MSTNTVPLKPIRTCNSCGQATTEYTEHDVFGTTHVVCSGCETAADQSATKTGTRADAREKVAQARELLRDAARIVDGDFETIRHNCTTAIVATDDVLDSIQSAVDADLREWADLHGENAGQLAAEARGEC